MNPLQVLAFKQLYFRSGKKWGHSWYQNRLDSAFRKSGTPARFPVYFTWRISGIPHLNVIWQYVGVPDAKCPVVMWSHLT